MPDGNTDNIIHCPPYSRVVLTIALAATLRLCAVADQSTLIQQLVEAAQQAQPEQVISKPGEYGLVDYCLSDASGTCLIYHQYTTDNRFAVYVRPMVRRCLRNELCQGMVDFQIKPDIHIKVRPAPAPLTSGLCVGNADATACVSVGMTYAATLDLLVDNRRLTMDFMLDNAKDYVYMDAKGDPEDLMRAIAKMASGKKSSIAVLRFWRYGNTYNPRTESFDPVTVAELKFEINPEMAAMFVPILAKYDSLRGAQPSAPGSRRSFGR